MAVAAETINHERPPESEIYGRSLSTPYRLGVVAVEHAIAEATRSPEADQAREEFYTSVEEGSGTDKDLGENLKVRKFYKQPVMNGKIMSKDCKTAVSDMTEAGLICAEEKFKRESAKGDRRFFPQLKRTSWDHKGALTNDQMARSETSYNTRIAMSPFVEEGAAASGDDYWDDIGYVSHLKRGFVWLWHVLEDGSEVLAGSLSFDGSNKERLRQISRKHGVEIPEDEITDNWSQYAITGNFTEEQAKALALEIADEATDPIYKKTENTVDLTEQNQAMMDKVFDESYIHVCESLARGYQTEGARKLIFQLANNATNFNENYEKALYRMRANEQQFTDEDMIVLHELLVYSAIEMMRALHIERTEAAAAGHDMSSYQVRDPLLEMLHQNPAIFQNALGDFAAEGAKANRSYSACGLSISVGSDPSNPDSSGGSASMESSRKKVMTCPLCDAKVFDDPCAVVLACKDCLARVVNGHTESKGDGGTAAKKAKQKAEKERRHAELAQQIDEIYKARGLSEDTFDKQLNPAATEQTQPAKVPAAA